MFTDDTILVIKDACHATARALGGVDTYNCIKALDIVQLAQEEIENDYRDFIGQHQNLGPETAGLIEQIRSKLLLSSHRLSVAIERLDNTGLDDVVNDRVDDALRLLCIAKGLTMEVVGLHPQY